VSTHDDFIDSWVRKQPTALTGVEATLGMTKRVPGGYLHLGSRFHPREFSRRPTVNVPEFDMAQTAVTVQQYAAFLNSGGAKDSRWWSKEGWAWVNGQLDGWGREGRWLPDRWETQITRPYHPVVGVTWFEAEAYCRWLSEERKQDVRLPAEAEWERAARGDDDRPFPWGEAFDPARTNTLESENRDTLPVASSSGDVSPFGIMEMAGNVQEWTATAYTPLPDEVFPRSPVPLRAARGGSFNDTAYGARTTYRRGYPPGYFFPFLGLRVVTSSL
jgi:formylglycine-generating enzyme required for sulfatase activity